MTNTVNTDSQVRSFWSSRWSMCSHLCTATIPAMRSPFSGFFKWTRQASTWSHWYHIKGHWGVLLSEFLCSIFCQHVLIFLLSFSKLDALFQFHALASWVNILIWDSKPHILLLNILSGNRQWVISAPQNLHPSCWSGGNKGSYY